MLIKPYALKNMAVNYKFTIYLINLFSTTGLLLADQDVNCGEGMYTRSGVCRPCSISCEKIFRRTIISCSQFSDYTCGPCLIGYEEVGGEHYCHLKKPADVQSDPPCLKDGTCNYNLPHEYNCTCPMGTCNENCKPLSRKFFISLIVSETITFILLVAVSIILIILWHKYVPKPTWCMKNKLKLGALAGVKFEKNHGHERHNKLNERKERSALLNAPPVSLSTQATQPAGEDNAELCLDNSDKGYSVVWSAASRNTVIEVHDSSRNYISYPLLQNISTMPVLERKAIQVDSRYVQEVC